ncbi:MAG: DUF2959 domain-containing protein [Phycisphaerae bacterium]|nr:DUF2959 domain-containing protein [Phycisphaerae bacterium]
MCVRLLTAALAGLTVCGGGCDSAYYKTMEVFGKHKRDLLVSRVADARDAQTEAKEQFASALERFNAVVNHDGGKLQDKYDKLKADLDRSESKAAAVRKRIAEVEEVAGDLFAEWKAELKKYTNESLRRASEVKLNQTRDRYESLIIAMKAAETRIEPVLVVFRDQVLFLKHNLNAQAVASLKGELGNMETDIAGLIRAMEASIAEADAFLTQLETTDQ